MKKILVLSPFVLILIGAVLVPSPVPIPKDAAYCVQLDAEVITIGEGGDQDIVFVLQGTSTILYINRCLESDLTLKQVSEQTMGKTDRFFYPKYWTPLDPNNRIRHVSKVVLQN